MADTYDAVIIGAGIIGAAVGYELAKDGKKTLNVDALPAAGYGSTSNSCAIIRVHYSTVDATALAAEAYYDWLDWHGYLGPGGSADDSGLAAFHATGCLVMKTAHNGRLERNCEILDQLSIPYEHWSPKRILERLPLYDLKSFFPPKTLEDDSFGEPTGGAVEGGVFFPTAGYISDPQLATHNIQRAAEAHGATFRFNAKVTAIPTAGGEFVFGAGVKAHCSAPWEGRSGAARVLADSEKVTERSQSGGGMSTSAAGRSTSAAGNDDPAAGYVDLCRLA